MEPVLVKTVSYFKVSVFPLMDSLASGLVIKLSFLQAENEKQKTKSKRQ